jgi:hypothetical protein
MSLHAPSPLPQDSQRKVILTSARNYSKWGAAMATVFQEHNLLHEMDTKLEYFPSNCAKKCEWEEQYWVITIKTHAGKYLKEAAILKPTRRALDTEFKDTYEGLRAQADDSVNQRAFQALEKAYEDKQFDIKREDEEREEEYKKQLTMAIAVSTQHLKGASRGKAFTKVIESLHEDFRSAIAEVEYGDPSALLLEVDKFMLKDGEGYKAALFLEFYAATFEQQGCNVLQTWINYVSATTRTLASLGESTTLTAKKARFIDKLPDEIFHIWKVSMYNQKTLTWEELKESVVSFAQTPSVAIKLQQLSRAHSRSAHMRPQAEVFGFKNEGEASAPKEGCRNYLKGTCTREHCKYRT